MKTSLDHLPAKQQRELETVVATLMSEFDAALRGGGGPTQPWRRNGKILKIILFGSYSRNDWVDAPDNGYLSDYDLLVIVSHENLTNIADYWYVAEDKILRDPSVGRIVNLVVHTMGEVNQALGRGEYFWTDIIRDGITLYELPSHPFAMPQPMTAEDAYEMAQRYYATWIASVDRALITAQAQLANGDDLGWRRDATFSTHQAVERSYGGFLLVHTFYFPRSHNIKFLRSLAEAVDKTLVEAWPREQRFDKRRFELLKRAYVDARYSDQFEVSVEDLTFLIDAAHRLRLLVQAACELRLQVLRRDLGPDSAQHS